MPAHPQTGVPLNIISGVDVDTLLDIRLTSRLFFNFVRAHKRSICRESLASRSSPSQLGNPECPLRSYDSPTMPIIEKLEQAESGLTVREMQWRFFACG